MTTAVFDFDSTLIDCESLEEILKSRLRGNKSGMQAIEAITRAGMDGSIGFRESLERRLEIACPRLDDVLAFGEQAIAHLTAGMSDFIHWLGLQGVDIWIVSGAFRESILALGRVLGVPSHKIHAVMVDWNEDGGFKGLRDEPFSHSKIEGVKRISDQWTRPVLMVGDGMTDYQVFDSGMADVFIAFTQHARRESVVSRCRYEAQDVRELRALVEESFLRCRTRKGV